ncbi:hypothetical protein ACFWXA_05460 [Streptomyces atroolivaceus]|uniref:hypothetical protein n=1 Tax=Streptomyces atroolivaceus TaxID=66869 RepID=UPI00365C97CC
MAANEVTPTELTALEQSLCDALAPLASALRARDTELPEDQMWAADPVEVSLAVLAGWKVVDSTVTRLTARAARTAGAYGASYEQLGTAWGITRQGARKKWPDAVNRPTAAGEPGTVELFGGTAELYREPSSGGWRWRGRGADGIHGAADGSPACGTKEEAAAYAGAFLKEHARARPDPSGGR